MSFRKEQKYRLTKSDMRLIKGQLIGRGMDVLFPRRSIHSLYFDSRELSAFRESEEGVLPRKKIRVRWYNSDSRFSKETKVSSIEGRYKYSEALSRFDPECSVEHRFSMLAMDI